MKGESARFSLPQEATFTRLSIFSSTVKTDEHKADSTMSSYVALDNSMSDVSLFNFTGRISSIVPKRRHQSKVKCDQNTGKMLDNDTFRVDEECCSEESLNNRSSSQLESSANAPKDTQI